MKPHNRRAGHGHLQTRVAQTLTVTGPGTRTDAVPHEFRDVDGGREGASPAVPDPGR